MKTAYELKDGEIIYTPTGEKVATLNDTDLRMARGFADEHKESVEAWLPSQGYNKLEKSPPSNAVVDKPAVETPAARSLVHPPRPEPTLEAGDKTRENVAWLRDYGTDEEKETVKRWAKMLGWADGLPPENSEFTIAAPRKPNHTKP